MRIMKKSDWTSLFSLLMGLFVVLGVYFFSVQNDDLSVMVRASVWEGGALLISAMVAFEFGQRFPFSVSDALVRFGGTFFFLTLAGASILLSVKWVGFASGVGIAVFFWFLNNVETRHLRRGLKTQEAD